MSIVKDWAESKGLDWFGFLREYTLLRGCKELNSCDDVPDHLAHPYGRAASGADLFGNISEQDYWSHITPSDDIHGFIETPFTTPSAGFTSIDGGVAQVNADNCRYDSVIDLYYKHPSAKTIMGWGSEGDLFELPHLVFDYQAGKRMDIVDDLTYVNGLEYRWNLSYGPDCVGNLATVLLEVWRRTSDAGSLEYVANGIGTTDTVTFTTAAPSGTPDTTAVTLLVGNDEWEPASEEPFSCDLKIEIVGCPCLDMPKRPDPGSSDIVYCKLEDSTELPYCNASGALAPGLLSEQEYELCWGAYSSLMGTYCGLAPPS